ncbi:MAG: hypothetical protein ABW041_07090 [Dehalococcoides mccartyi]
MENIKDVCKVSGKFITECYRKGKLIWREESRNIVTTEGRNRLLDVMFHGTTQISTWYCGLVETDTTPDAGMTYDVPTFTESTAYDEAARPAFVEAASSSGSVTNSANKAVFTISGTKTMYGAALFSISTKGDHTAGADNVLYCYSKFTSGRSVVDDDVINLTYTVTAADDGA